MVRFVKSAGPGVDGAFSNRFLPLKEWTPLYLFFELMYFLPISSIVLYFPGPGLSALTIVSVSFGKKSIFFMGFTIFWVRGFRSHAKASSSRVFVRLLILMRCWCDFLCFLIMWEVQIICFVAKAKPFIRLHLEIRCNIVGRRWQTCLIPIKNFASVPKSKRTFSCG